MVFGKSLNLLLSISVLNMNDAIRCAMLGVYELNELRSPHVEFFLKCAENDTKCLLKRQRYDRMLLFSGHNSQRKLAPTIPNGVQEGFFIFPHTFFRRLILPYHFRISPVYLISSSFTLQEGRRG